jgi:hypothetical protein
MPIPLSTIESFQFVPAMAKPKAIYITTISSAVGEGLLERCPGGSKPSEQNQDQNYNEHEAEPAATVVAGPVEGAAPEAAEASE